MEQPPPLPLFYCSTNPVNLTTKKACFTSKLFLFLLRAQERALCASMPENKYISFLSCKKKRILMKELYSVFIIP